MFPLQAYERDTRRGSSSTGPTAVATVLVWVPPKVVAAVAALGVVVLTAEVLGELGF